MTRDASLNRPLMAILAAAIVGLGALTACDTTEPAGADASPALADPSPTMTAPAEQATTEMHLLMSIGLGDIERVAELLDEGADPNAKFDPGTTLLSQAAYRSEAEIVALLIDAGADPNLAQADGFTPLMLASVFADGATVQALLDGGADTELRDERGRTALEWAQDNGREIIADILRAADARD